MAMKKDQKDSKYNYDLQKVNELTIGWFLDFASIIDLGEEGNLANPSNCYNFNFL